MSAEKNIGTTLIKTKSGSESTDLTIADLLTIGRIGVTSDEKDVTTLDSANGYKEFIAMAKDAGELPLTGLIKSEANVEAMLALAESQALEAWTITAVSGSTWTFSAFVKMFEEGEMSVDGVRNFNATLRISGKPTYTKVTPSA